jgi:hypothetical protein
MLGILRNGHPPPLKKNAGKNMLGKCTLEFNYKKYSVHVFMRRKKIKKSSVEKMEGGEHVGLFFLAKGRVVTLPLCSVKTCSLGDILTLSLLLPSNNMWKNTTIWCEDKMTTQKKKKKCMGE